MQRLILALALPTNVVHGFMCWSDAPIGAAAAGGDHGITASGGDLHTRFPAGVNQPFLRPDMGVDDALKR
jgi:hypothetical protein